MSRLRELERLAGEHGLAAVYLFGSRLADGLAVLRGERVAGAGSDLDVALLFRGPADLRALTRLQSGMEDVFAPLRVDLVPLDRVDPIFQFRAISGERVVAPARRAADLFELEAMRSASELLPAQRAMERERFGAATT